MGTEAAWKSLRVRFLLMMGDCLEVRYPLSLHMGMCECMIWKAYLESGYMFTVCPLVRISTLIRAISSACWQVVLGGKDLHSRILSRLVIT